MSKKTTHHESAPLYHCAKQVYRLVVDLARTDSRTLNENLRAHALRGLMHCTAASDAASERQRAQSLRFAKLAALKLFAVLEAVACEGQGSAVSIANARNALQQLVGELDQSLRPADLAAPVAPSAAPSEGGRAHNVASTADPMFEPFDPSRVIPRVVLPLEAVAYNFDDLEWFSDLAWQAAEE